MPDSFSNETIGLTSQVRYRAVGEDGVLVHLENGRVIVVNEVGLRVVQLLDRPRTRQELAAAIAGEFDVSTEQAEIDIGRFIAELDREQVLNRSW
jgi:hypothetical protein